MIQRVLSSFVLSKEWTDSWEDIMENMLREMLCEKHGFKRDNTEHQTPSYDEFTSVN